MILEHKTKPCACVKVLNWTMHFLQFLTTFKNFWLFWQLSTIYRLWQKQFDNLIFLTILNISFLFNFFDHLWQFLALFLSRKKNWLEVALGSLVLDSIDRVHCTLYTEQGLSEWIAKAKQFSHVLLFTKSWVFSAVLGQKWLSKVLT